MIKLNIIFIRDSRRKLNKNEIVIVFRKNLSIWVFIKIANNQRH